MICPICLVQMRQKFDDVLLKEVGGGIAEDERYITWEVKECKECGREVLEYYAALAVNDLDQAIKTAYSLSTLTNNEQLITEEKHGNIN